MRIGGERVSATEQSLGLQNDDLKPAFDASADQTNAASLRRNLLLPNKLRLIVASIFYTYLEI